MTKFKSAFFIISFLGIVFFSGQSEAMAAPAQPSMYTPACSSSGTSVTLSWGNVSGPVTYHVRLQQSGSSNEQPRSTGSSRSSTYSIQAGTSYTWWVHAVDSSGWSNWTKKSFSCSAPNPPQTPTGLSHTCNSAGTSVTLRWNGVSGNAGYNVKLSGANYNSFGTSKSISINPGQNYSWRVQAKAPSGVDWSNFSSSRSFSCAAAPPAVPSGLSHTCNANGTGVTLRWNPASGADRYDIEFNSFGYDTPTNSRYFGINPNLPNQWRVRSKAPSPTPWSNYSGFSNFSCPGPVQPPEPAQPNQPTFQCLGTTQVRVSWNSVSGAIRYPIRLRDNQTAAEVFANDTNTNTSFVMNIQSGREYVSWVHAENNNVRSIASSPVVFTCPTRLAAPYAGTGTGPSNSGHSSVLCGGPNNSGSAKIGSNTSATIAWGKVAGATNYPVRIRTKNELRIGGSVSRYNPGSDTTVVENSNGLHTFYGIEHDVRYGFWAHAQYTAGNWSGASDWFDYNRLHSGEALFMCAGSAPTVPSISVSGSTGNNRTGVFSATDTNNDPYMIEVDINGDGIADFTSGAATTVSGQSVSVAMSFPGAGSYTLRARAIDHHDRKSAWATYPGGVTISGPTTPQCSDGLDKDGDCLTDMADPGCSSPTDTSETNTVATPQCSDGLDKDGDCLTDMADPGCTSGSDNSENTPTLAAPNMTLSTERTVIRRGDVVIEWDTDVTYAMDCTIRGAGIDPADPAVDVDFDPSEDGPTGSVTARNLNSAGVYVLTCVEPINNTTHVETLQIEVVGTIQEI